MKRNDNTIKEIWKTIGNTRYQVSNIGRVRSTDYKRTGQTKLLSLLNGKTGYKFVILDKKTCYVHRLVAEAFIPNPDNLPQINHKDENKSNNFVENLEWCSQKYNVNYGNRNAHHSQTCLRKRIAMEDRIQKFIEGKVQTEEQILEHRKVELEMRILEVRREIMECEQRKEELQKELNKLMDEKNKGVKITTWDRHAVLQYDMDGHFIKEWKSVYEVYKELGIGIGACVKGRKESVGGFMWCYKLAR